MAEVYAADGAPVALGPRLAAGGEGAVHELPGRVGLCAKVYHNGKRAGERRAKLDAMLARVPADPTAAEGHRSIAWPLELLFAKGARPAPLAGFVMPLLPEDARTALEYLQPEDRIRLHPGWGFRHLLTASRNLAAAVAALHHAGCCVGDLNESNVMVSATTARVTLIDCDSFQVPLPSGAVARCPVGRQEYAAPEFVGRSLSEVDRTAASDAFALGVLVFQLLMQGYHPFSGRWRGGGEPPDVARRIRDGLYAYGGARDLVPPPAAPTLAVLPRPARALLDRTFGPGVARPAQRPSAKDWVAALDASLADLVRCRRHPERHLYPRQARACPWCALAQRGSDYFPDVVGAQIAVLPPGPGTVGPPRAPNRPENAPVAGGPTGAPPAATGVPPAGVGQAAAPGGPAAPAPAPPARPRTPARAAGNARLVLDPAQVVLAGVVPNAGPRAATVLVRNIGKGAFVGQVEVVPPSAALRVTPERLTISPYYGENEARLQVHVDPRQLGEAWGQRLVRSVRLVDTDGVRAAAVVSVTAAAPTAPDTAAGWCARVGAWGAALLAADLSARAARRLTPGAVFTLKWLRQGVLAPQGAWHATGIWLWLAGIVTAAVASGPWRLRGTRVGWSTLWSDQRWRPGWAAGAIGLALWPVVANLLVSAFLRHPSPRPMQWALGVAFVPAAALAARGLGAALAGPLRRFLVRRGAGPLASLAVVAALAVAGTAAAALVAASLRALPPAALAALRAVPSPVDLFALWRGR